MNTSYSEIKYYVDTLIVETVLADPTLVKHAQSGIVDTIKNEVTKYVSGVQDIIDPEQKTASFLSLIAPGLVFSLLKRIVPKPIAIIGGILTSVFRVEIKDIIAKIYDNISDLISGGKQTTSAAVDNAVKSAVMSSIPTPNVEHAKQYADLHKKETAPTKEKTEDETDIFSASASFHSNIRDARMFKLALIDYEESFVKQANTNPIKTPSTGVMGVLGKISSIPGILTSLLGWIFKTALVAGGFFIAGDVINRMVDRPSIGGKTIQKGKAITAPPPVTVPKATQTKFPLNKNYREENMGNTWLLNYPATQPDIEDLVLEFTNDVYSGLEDKQNLVLNNPKFKGLINSMLATNAGNLGTNIVLIPFRSKREVVDMFIDDVARSA